VTSLSQVATVTGEPQDAPADPSAPAVGRWFWLDRQGPLAGLA